jgi:hypothetical protein
MNIPSIWTQMPPITELQKRKIKLMVDELIVNRGILALRDRWTEVDGLNMNKLGNMAFRYYKMILLGESPLDIDIKSPNLIEQHASESAFHASKACIGCGEMLLSVDIRNRMPACQACREKIRVDYELLRELFL